MTNTVMSFQELTSEHQALAGGKGGTLAKMFRDGYPVPEGFVVFPPAFQDETLSPEAWRQVQTQLHTLRKHDEQSGFAVRSSALSEDTAQASFAGEFETVLNVKTDAEVQAAIDTVYQSRLSERVKAYSSAQGMKQSHQVAVVIQHMVQSEISGVLFTVDPITRSYTSMLGNYVYGLGEQLVSGRADAYSFKLLRPKGRYDGPDALAKYSSKLHKFAARLEQELNGPLDIEWAVAKGNLYLLQARPITTLTPGNLDTYEINESLAGDALWVNANVGEAIPDVVTPLTWSLIRELDNESNAVPGYYLWSGNICGRIYSNLSQRLSAVTALYGWDPKHVMHLLIGDVFGHIPDEVTIPDYPFSRFSLLKEMLPKIKKHVWNFFKTSRNLPEFLAVTPAWCSSMAAQLKSVQKKEALLSLWQDELDPYIAKAWWGLLVGGSKAVFALTLSKKLIKLVGTEDANTLLSNLRGGSELASLGPLVGIAKVSQGEMSREDYLLQYGHRGPHEFELSIPDPAEDDTWLERQIAEFENSAPDVAGLLNRQHIRYEDAKRRFQEHYPRKARWLEQQLAKASESARLREAARSELTRVFRVVRSFAVRTGELTGIGDGVFFLYIDEVEALLAGNAAAVERIAARRENYEKFNALPPFPSIIRGRFNPFEWIKEPNRRMDYYDATARVAVAPDSATLRGFGGAAGRAEGIVRVMASPEEGDRLQPGEVLVAATTNVGWTLLFPKAAAIVTDVGAPLSHAAIVARELGIPAVVGCGDATTRLKTGDRVIVDGGMGIVQIVN
jgi:pyruvate,water dikinase